MKTYKKGEIIAKEGEIGNEFFFLMSGKVGAFKEDLVVSEFTEKGTVFGELAAILKRPRSLTLIAMEDTQVLVFDGGYEKLVLKHPEFAKRLMIFLAERLETTTDKLWAIKSVISNTIIENNLLSNENSN
ncbi:MAG: cyclic nucleotide-binding domain-containing protein [Bacteroidota bacterium]|nr:cyclic nucleotide-binding domain-containing protein [Bacteroidota bacterium]